MDCAEVLPLLDEYASGEATGTLHTALDEHLGRCADCRHALHDLLALDERVRALPSAPVPDDFLAQVHAKLPSQRFGLDQHDTAPSAWLGDHEPTSDVDERFLRLARIAA